MRQYTTKEIEKKFKEIFLCKSAYSYFKVEVVENTNKKVVIIIQQMYEYIECNFSHLLKVSAFFETKHINDEKDWHGGCETCDYGSNYKITLVIEPE